VQIYLPIADLPVNVFVILAMGLAVGFISGMFGIGGGFLMTPLLIFLGITPAVAVASVTGHIAASSMSGAISYWRRSAIDLALAFMLLAGGIIGTASGVWLFTTLRAVGQLDITIGISYVLLLSIVGALMVAESVRAIIRAQRGKPVELRRPGSHTWIHGLPFKLRFKRSRIYVSAIPVWGIGFSDGRKYTLEECRRLIEFLKHDPEAGGCTVMVGVPAHWRELNRDAISDPKLLEVLKLADVISPWTVGRYTSLGGAKDYAEKQLKPDLAWCRQQKIDYLPVVFPGFSWYNMYGEADNLIPRLGGQFLWSQFLGAKQAGASMVYVAMFDEVDEGTAIFKCANNVPVGEKSRFLTFDGLPSDYFLKMVGAGAKLIGREPLKAAMSKSPAFTSQSNGAALLNMP